MATAAFDTLGYFEKLKASGVPEEQAKVQVEAMQDIVRSYDETSRKDLAAKGDIQSVRSGIHDVRREIHEVKFELLKWMMGIAVAQIVASVALFAIK
jgi:hypothetical protein